MKKLALILVLMASYSAVASTHKSPLHNRAAEHIVTSEKSVFEAVWFNQNYLRVTRYATGSSQDGFAEYLCYSLQETGYKGPPVTLEIIDVVKLVRQKEWDVIGEANCAYHPRH